MAVSERLWLFQVEKTVWDWELMNDIKPIWQRPAKEVEEDEYKAFYKTFSKVRTSAVPIHLGGLALRLHANGQRFPSTGQ